MFEKRPSTGAFFKKPDKTGFLVEPVVYVRTFL